jgi:hypothetical protein
MNSTLIMAAVLAGVAMLSAGLVVVSMQQASAQDTSFNFKIPQSNKCSGIFAGLIGCGNLGLILFGGL